MDHIDPRRSKSYIKTPDRVFTLKQDVLVPAGTTFRRAPLERGGADTIEGLVRLGADAAAYLSVPLRVVEIDAAEWFKEDKGDGEEVL